ncbi:DUF86 domain-containing protein [Bacillus sp. 1NLA3E]|uniref:DUF86 domain-containing protein n=1 Tax=Bacillus sp. 1NLA3E TaxID=666686 RepID=UPI000247F387|nr:DUF86 domain-containing protein [Bacillus sp. 1NLA3E]AGK55482.1 hypothetical protein B1NLA3E_18690 [Bacillus sp. 1NLA3E]
MYFIDREKIEAILVYLEKQISLFERTQDWNTPVEKAALERIPHIMIEAILDVGNDIIDGFIMRDPGSYEDIIDILTDEKVVSEEVSLGLKTIIPYRKILVQQYMEISHEALQQDFTDTLPILKKFAPMVRQYLETELSPVSAFKK